MNRPLKILFACTALHHSSAQRRITEAEKHGVRLTVYDARIDRGNTRILRRILSLCYFKLFWRLVTSGEPIWWLWGIDVSMVGSLAGLIRFNKKIIWDISDINPRFLRGNVYSKTLRGIESFFLKRADRLILTSGRFYDYYYKYRINKKDVFVVENLIQGEPSECKREPATDSLNVVYCGILRTDNLLNTLIETSYLCGARVTFNLWGIFDRNVKEDTIARIMNNPHIVFHGKYRPAELSKVYDGMHITFGLVDISSNENEKWLLPNRFYQAGAYRCPILANSRKLRRK